jgi:hypothetical protein
MPARPGSPLKLREIVLGVGAGAVAAGLAALILSESGDSPRQISHGDDRQTYAVAPFEEISTFGPQDIEITYGETQSIRAEGPAETLGKLEVVVVDGALTIRPKDLAGMQNWPGFSETTFHITVPRLARVTLAGPGDVTVDRVEGERFEGSVAGSGELSIASLKVAKAELSINGGGTLAATGIADQTRVSIGGSGEVEANGLKSKTASISIGGSGDVELTVDDEALISIGGSGNVEINGSATCSVSRMGSGEVVCNGQEQ